MILKGIYKRGDKISLVMYIRYSSFKIGRNKKGNFIYPKIKYGFRGVVCEYDVEGYLYKNDKYMQDNIVYDLFVPIRESKSFSN